MEAAEPNAPLDKVFPERAPGLCPEQGPFSLQVWISHRGHLGLGQEPVQALPAGVVTHALTRVLLPKPEQVLVQVEVDVLIVGVGYRCLWLGVLQAQRSDMPSVLASTQLARCLWEGKS